MNKPSCVTALLVSASLVAASPAQARDADHESIRATFDLCGSGVIVQYAEEIDLHLISRKVRGSEDTYSFTVWSDGAASWTNPTNHRTVTMTYQKVDRDVRVTDNGDGTRTIHTLNNRIEKYVGPDGERLMNRGPIWLDVVVADAGTPQDPSDDYWVDFLGYRIGGNFDMGETWCDQMVTWLA